MGIEVKVVADSVWNDNRITTFQVRVPRCIWPEVLTHCAFSRSARSSRAVPIEKMIQEIIDDPYIPPIFGRNVRGMQPGAEVENAEQANAIWLAARDSAVEHARALDALGCHKEDVNRLIEPFGWIDAVITATNFEGFLNLRSTHKAEKNMRQIASLIADQLNQNEPNATPLHLPYISDDERKHDYLCDLVLASSARCARVSYKPFSGESSLDQDIALGSRLALDGHLSPFEHVAHALVVPTPANLMQGVMGNRWGRSENYISGKFKNWRQLRWYVDGESVGLCKNFGSKNDYDFNCMFTAHFDVGRSSRLKSDRWLPMGCCPKCL